MELDQFRDVDLVIDRANDSFVQKQFVSQGDYKGRSLTVQVTNNGSVGEVPGLTLNLRWHNEASGITDLSAFSVVDKSNSIFRIEYPQNMLTPGKVFASIQILQNGKTTQLKEFELTVQRLAGEAVGIAQKAEFSALVAILADSNKFRTDIDRKADKTFVDAQFASIVSGAPKGTFTTLDSLKAAYPSGTEGIFLVLSDGHWYYWNNSTSTWTSGGVYQAEKSKFSIIPKDQRLWHTFKVDGTVGSSYIFNNTTNTLENTTDYFETSIAGYGTYSIPLPINQNDVGSTLQLRGTNNYRVSLIEYSVDLKVIAATQWANTVDKVISNDTRFIVIGVKRYDDAPMKLSELALIDCEILSDKIQSLNRDINQSTIESFGEWIQGAYSFLGNGQTIGVATYSNFRMANFVNVNPSTVYKLKCSLLAKYRFVLVLADEKNRQIMNCGWVTTKNEVVIRTPPNCSKIYIMLANVDDTKTFKDADRLLMGVKLSTTSNIEVDQYRGPVSSQPFLVNNTWFNLSIGKGSDGKVSTPVATNRLLTRFDVKNDKIYSIETDAPSNYRFNYVQADDTGNYLHDTYWQIGGCRIKNDVKGYVYISVHKVDESNNAVDINLSEAANFTITVKETTVFNELLERRFRSRLICHRGASAIEPENTLPAFARCGILNVWGCEMDVQLTKDKHFVIIHDDTVDRTTNGTGKVAELTLDEIKALTVDWGPNISNYPDLKVPTLKEAVDTCRIYGTIPVFDIGTFGLGNGDVGAVNQFLNELSDLGIIRDCIILCQGTFLASLVRQKNKLTPIIVQYTGLVGADLEARRLFRFENAYCGGWNLTATDDQLKELYAVGKTYQLQFYAITNDKEQAKKYLELGCDFISSDHPDILTF
ncbi:glycerophosphodiester phosphodiesterase [Enterococcus gallinarum]|uniref:glycerophosphodiester phosphodiesterase n=1 Tax=Enterococcus gallinarum TaxID=1353 RepID=UPI001CAA65C1|nr:glycerophosphodiester phosphodiesterase family protein [Enterococcus gallinarum]